MRTPLEIATAFSPREALEGCRAFFLVGIGGAGMSGLARMLARRGFTVAGSDGTVGLEVERLREDGIDVAAGHRATPVHDFVARSQKAALIVSDAIPLAESPEVAAARALDLPIVRRSQALGWLLKRYRVVAVTGTHGKTTTTGMIGAGLIAAGMDPLVVVGASVPEWGGPIREGLGQWAVVEACEAYDSFHDLDPAIVVLTNLELDHVDYHGTWDNLRASVVRFTDRLPPQGMLVFCADDRGASEVAELTQARTAGYGLSETWARQVANRYDLQLDETDAPPLLAAEMALPGEHNRMNAMGALLAIAMVGEQAGGLDLSAADRGIVRFTGAERRLQVVQEGPVTLLDDYAHHPTEIVASLAAARDRYLQNRQGRLIVVFQPHLYSRTAPLIREFAEALDGADLVVLTDIYPAREAPMPGVSSARIAEAVTKPVRYVPSRHLLPREVARWVRPGDVVVAMGAGNIAEFPYALRDEMARSAVREARRLAIAVVCGGDSAEREVSLHSGIAVEAALRSLGHDAWRIDASDLLLARGDLSLLTGPERPDVAFLTVHGTHGEGGAVQGLFELLHIPYTGSNMLASALAMDKDRTKAVLAAAGIRVPQGVAVRSVEEALAWSLANPSLARLVVKPNAQGSTVGLTFLEDPGQLAEAVAKALTYDEVALVEEWVSGVEISTPVLGDRALPPVEIAPASGVYDFASKYLPGATEEIVPARIAPELLAEAERTALAAHRALGCAGATRTDAIVADGTVVVLEVNTLPGMTSTSLLPTSARAAGIEFPQLCMRIVEEALARDAAKA